MTYLNEIYAAAFGSINYNRSEEILGFHRENSAICVSEDSIMVFSDRDSILSTVYLMACYWNTI